MRSFIWMICIICLVSSNWIIWYLKNAYRLTDDLELSNVDLLMLI